MRFGLTIARFCDLSHHDPDDAIRAADVVLFKTYLAWRIKHGRIKKLSTIQTYWKSLCLIYAANAQVWMAQPVLSEMNNVCILQNISFSQDRR